VLSQDLGRGISLEMFEIRDQNSTYFVKGTAIFNRDQGGDGRGFEKA
jgi:hypothetical protein